MPGKKDKKQEKEDRNQRNKEKRAKRHASSSSEEHETEPSNSSHSVRTNGIVKDDSPADQARSLHLDDINATKFLSLQKTFQHLSEFTGVLNYMKHGAANAAEAFRPEIELRAENERLRETMDLITNAVETQQVKDLRQRCDILENERADLGRIQQETEQERKKLIKERKTVLDERMGMENELREKIATAMTEFDNKLAREKKTLEASLASVKKSAEETKELNAQLKEQSELTKQRAQNLQEGNDILMAETRKVRSELDKEKSRFSLQSKGIDY